MKQRQAIMKTYYDGKSIKAQPINLNDRVMVYDPKLKGLKLHPKCIGLNLVINKSKHLHEVQFETYKWVKTRCLPRDCLRKTNSILLKYIENEIRDDCTNIKHIEHDYESSDDDNIVQRWQQRQDTIYNSRPRNIQPNYRVNLFQTNIM